MNNTIELKSTIGGQYRAKVFTRGGKLVKDYGWQKNLILPAGYNGTAGTFDNMMQYCHVGTGSTPNAVLLDGTFQQTGTSLTRATGTGVFSAGNVGDFVKFATGETAKIVTYTNTVTVVVDRSQTVAAAALTVYDTSRVLLDARVKQSTSASSATLTQNTDLRAATTKKTYDFAFETSPKTYTEVGVGGNGAVQLLSRILFDTPVNVDTDQFLQVEYQITKVVAKYGTEEAMAVSITGWPRPYNIQSIVASGTYFDILLDAPHHYATGRQIIIAGALPVKNAIASLSSTGGDFTVTTTGNHNKSPGDSVVIEGATPAGYNGTWTVATTPTATTLTVTTGVNPGAGSGGTIRLATPVTWFNGTWTAASFPTSSTIRVTSAITPVPAGVAGNVTNSIAATCICVGFGWNSGVGAFDASLTKDCHLVQEASMITSPAYGVTKFFPATTAATRTSESYDSATRKSTMVRTFASAISNGNVRQIYLKPAGNPGSGLLITFAERQVKEVGFQLALTWVLSWEPELV